MYQATAFRNILCATCLKHCFFRKQVSNEPIALDNFVVNLRTWENILICCYSGWLTNNTIITHLSEIFVRIKVFLPLKCKCLQTHALVLYLFADTVRGCELFPLFVTSTQRSVSLACECSLRATSRVSSCCALVHESFDLVIWIEMNDAAHAECTRLAMLLVDGSTLPQSSIIQMHGQTCCQAYYPEVQQCDHGEWRQSNNDRSFCTNCGKKQK